MSSHFRYLGIIIINTGITTNVQLNSAKITTRNIEKRLESALLEELSNRSAVANATAIDPAVAVINPSSKKVPRAKDVKANADAGASKKKIDLGEDCGKTTSQTAAKAYPRIDISNSQVNEKLVQSDKSLELESFPNSTVDPEFRNIEMVLVKCGVPRLTN